MTAVFKANGNTIATEAIKIRGDNQTIPGGVQGLPSTAWYGEISTATIIIDDPHGIYSFQAWMTFTVDETACVGRERVFTGWILRERVMRGGYQHGTARVWEIDIMDQNEALSLEVFRPVDSPKRPAETDLQRITWLLGSNGLDDTPVVAGDFTNLTDNPAPFTESDFTGQFPAEVVASTAPNVSKNSFVFWNHDEARLELFYDSVENLPACTLSISNDPADITYPLGDASTVFPPLLDAQLSRTGEEVNTGELLNYRGAFAYGARQATINDLSPTPLSPSQFKRDRVKSTDRIGKAQTAQAQIANDLEYMANEVDTITCTIRLPAALVNYVEAGMKISGKFVHFPGYEDAVDMRIVRHNKLPTSGRRDWWDVILELSNKVRLRDADGGDPDTFPPTQQCDVANVSIVQWAKASQQPVSGFVYKGATWPAPPTPGNLLIMAWLLNGQVVGSPATQAGTWLDEGYEEITAAAEDMPGIGGAGATHNYYWKIATASENLTPESDFGSVLVTNVQNNGYLIEVSGVDSIDELVKGQANGTTNLPVGFGLVPTAGKVAIIFTFLSYNTAAGGPATPKAGVTELVEESNISDGLNPVRVIDYKIIDNTTGSYDVNSTLAGTPDWVSASIAFICSGDADNTCPVTGQWTDWTFLQDGDGTTDTFTIPCPYADGGLRVRVDGKEIVIGLDETDPAAGEFALDFAPKAAIGDSRAEKVYYRFQGR